MHTFQFIRMDEIKDFVIYSGVLALIIKHILLESE